MKKTLILCLLAFCLASAAQKDLAIFNCTGDYDPDESKKLRDKLQEIVRNALPVNDYLIVNYEAAKKKLTEKYEGDEEKAEKAINKAECSASGVCYRELLLLIEANYNARCEISKNSEGRWVFKFSLDDVDKNGLVDEKSYDSYNPKKTSDFVDIMKKEVPIFLQKVFFGDLVVKPAYKDDIGKKENWSLRVNNVVQKSYENSFSPGNYDIKLTHNCYEDINSSVEINRGRTEMFDVAKHINLKTAELVLNAKRNDKPVNGEEVLVDGVKKGETPFTGTVALCSGISIGRKREKVEVKLLPNQRVEYTHEMSLVQKTSTFVAIGLDVLGAAAIGYAIYENMKASNAYDDYGKRGQSAEYYDDAWEKAKSSTTRRNVFYIVGGALLAAGVGVHIWF